MTCRLEGIILNDKQSLINRPDAISMNKYLIPVLRKDDHDEMACRILFDWMPESLGKDIPIDLEELTRRIGLKVIEGDFTEKGVVGEFFLTLAMLRS